MHGSFECTGIIWPWRVVVPIVCLWSGRGPNAARLLFVRCTDSVELESKHSFPWHIACTGVYIFCLTILLPSKLAIAIHITWQTVTCNTVEANHYSLTTLISPSISFSITCNDGQTSCGMLSPFTFQMTQIRKNLFKDLSAVH